MIQKNSQPDSINQTKEISSFLQETKNQYIAFLSNDYERKNSKTIISHGGYMKKQYSRERQNDKNLSGLLKVNSISKFINIESRKVSRQKDSISIFDNARLNNTLEKAQKQSLKRPCSAFTTIIHKPVNTFQEKVQRKSQVESRQEMSLLGKSCVKVSFREKQMAQHNQTSLKIDMNGSNLISSKYYASKSSHCLNKFKLDSKTPSKHHNLDKSNEKSNETFIQNRQKLASQISFYNPRRGPHKHQKQSKKHSSFKKVSNNNMKCVNSKKVDDSPIVLKKQPNKSENIHNWNSLYQNKAGHKKLFSTQLRKSIKKSQRKIDQMKMMYSKPVENPLIMIENIDKERGKIDENLYNYIASSQHFQRCRGAFQKVSPLLKERLKMSPSQHIIKKGRY